MDITVYLKQGTKIEDLPEYKQKQSKHYVCVGLELKQQDGKWCFKLSNDLNSHIPDSIKNYVEEIFFSGSLPDKGVKAYQDGLYVHKTANLELEFLDEAAAAWWFKIYSKNMEDALELFRMLRARTIKPKEVWPR